MTGRIQQPIWLVAGRLCLCPRCCVDITSSTGLSRRLRHPPPLPLAGSLPAHTTPSPTPPCVPLLLLLQPPQPFCASRLLHGGFLVRILVSWWEYLVSSIWHLQGRTGLFLCVCCLQGVLHEGLGRNYDVIHCLPWSSRSHWPLPCSPPQSLEEFVLIFGNSSYPHGRSRL
jgi:hypothetical protein